MHKPAFIACVRGDGEGSALQLPLPENEAARLATLKSFKILNTPPEQAFDDLTRLTSYICGTPIALIGFMDSDRLWFKSRLGWDVAEVPRDMAFCAHTVLQSGVIVVSDTLEDDRLRTCPLATHGGMRFYAGVSLMSAEGYALGTLCAMDSVPRGLTQGQTNALRKLAAQLMSLLELRRISPKSVLATDPIEQSDEFSRSVPQSEAHYGALVENTPDAVIEIDEDSNILLANRATEKIFGYTIEEVLGQPLTLLMPEHLRNIHRQAIKRYLATSKKHVSWAGVELPGQHKNGTEIALEISFGEYVRNGKRIFAGICRDITKRKRTEQEAMRLAAIVASSADAIIGKDLAGIITDWNKGAERIYGYTAEEVKGKPVSILAPPEREGEIPRIIERLKRGERIENYETVRVRRDGKRLHISLTVSALHDGAGKLVGFSAIGRDITEQKRAQENLRYSEQRLQGIITSAMDAIITIDSSQRIVLFNKAAEQVFRCTAADALGQQIGRFIPERFRTAHQRHIAGFGNTGITARSMYSPGTLFAIRADGEEFPIEASISQVEIEGEKLFSVILRDVSARMQVEAELRQAQRIEAIGQLAGGVAHEFNNFLGVILGYCELLSEDPGDRGTLEKHVAAIKTATQHATSLTRQLLAFGRKQLAEPQVVDVNQEIWESHKLLRRLVPANIDVIPILSAPGGRVQLGPGQLQQILINLLVNARDAMPQGGKVIIETAEVELDEASAGQAGLQPGGFVTLTISDTGSGMNSETRSHIFEPFYTTKEPGKGTGLGLSTVYGIVKNGGGHVSVETAEGEGATFRIYLPRVQEAIAATENAPAPPMEEIGTQTGAVLVVEDETALRRLLCISLQKRNYRVIAAKDGLDAVEKFRQHANDIQVVVSDLMMPRMDGFELREQISALRPDMKFLFMSGYAEHIVERGQKSLEDCVFLEKPFLPEELANKVRCLVLGESAA
jgi:two-component system cell cycle sensor histidine kinase/response regulator CckA